LVVVEAIIHIVDSLVVPRPLQFFWRFITLNSIRTPLTSSSAWKAVLVRHYLAIPPEVDECVRKDTSVPATISIIVTHAFTWKNEQISSVSAKTDVLAKDPSLTFPRNYACQTLWLTGSNSPLGAGVIADTEEADLPSRPRLRGSPLDNILETLAGRCGHCVHKSRTLAKSNLIGPYDCIVSACPIALQNRRVQGLAIVSDK